MNADRRHFSIRPTRDGAYTGEFGLTGSLGAKPVAVLSPLAKPRVEAIVLADGMASRGPLDAELRHHE